MNILLCNFILVLKSFSLHNYSVGKNMFVFIYNLAIVVYVKYINLRIV